MNGAHFAVPALRNILRRLSVARIANLAQKSGEEFQASVTFSRGSHALVMEPIQNELGNLFVALVQIHRVAVTRQSHIRQVNMIRS
jgi:hypothetical protein